MKTLCITLISLSVGVLIGMIFPANKTPAPSGQMLRGGNFSFINPLLECEVAVGTIDSVKQNFRPELKEFSELEIESGKASEIGIYFRDLNNGPTIGINEDSPFLPASLLKLPVAMSIYKISEDKPEILKKEINFKVKFTPPREQNKQLIPPEEEIAPGNTYTIEELVRRSLQFSDNQAVSLLYEELNTNNPIVIRELYTLLGVDQGVLDGPDGRLSVKQYSAFLRILFNSSYLNHNNSEKLLKILSEASFRDGLVSGVPKNIPVSHKFGESGYVNGEKQLHDCGIVYYPKHPYLLCVMTRGANHPNLELVIKSVSEFIYTKIEKAY